MKSRPNRSARVLALTLLVAGCSSGTSSSTSTSAPSSTSPSPAAETPTTSAPLAAPGTAITIKSFSFQPADLAAKVGDRITVTNDDGTNHSLTAVDGSFDTGQFDSGSKTFTLAKAGRFEFKCEVHSFMPHGSIQVSG